MGEVPPEVEFNGHLWKRVQARYIGRLQEPWSHHHCAVCSYPPDGVVPWRSLFQCRKCHLVRCSGWHHFPPCIPVHPREKEDPDDTEDDGDPDKNRRVRLPKVDWLRDPKRHQGGRGEKTN